MGTYPATGRFARPENCSTSTHTGSRPTTAERVRTAAWLAGVPRITRYGQAGMPQIYIWRVKIVWENSPYDPDNIGESAV